MTHQTQLIDTPSLFDTVIQPRPDINPWILNRDLWNANLLVLNTRIHTDNSPLEVYVRHFIFSLRKHHHHWADILLVAYLWRMTCCVPPASRSAPGYWVTTRYFLGDVEILAFMSQFALLFVRRDLFDNYDAFYGLWLKTKPSTRAALLRGPRQDPVVF